MKSRTTQVRERKLENMLALNLAINYVIINFRGNYRAIDGRELKQVLDIATKWAKRIKEDIELADNSNTNGFNQANGRQIKRGITK